MSWLNKIFDRSVIQLVIVMVLSLTIYGLLTRLGWIQEIPTIEDFNNNQVDEPMTDIPSASQILSEADNCKYRQLDEPFHKFFPNEDDCNKDVYKNYHYEEVMENENTPEEITDVSIIKASKKIEVKGQLDKLYMYIRATVTDKDYALLRKNSVYFYVDSGVFGGHLGAERLSSNSSALKDYPNDDIEAVFLSKAVPVEFVYNLNNDIRVAVPLGGTGSRPINFFERLGVEGVHYLYAFVSKKKYGRIEELSFLYSCKDNSPCSIAVQ